jgi:hypothetical protein
MSEASAKAAIWVPERDRAPVHDRAEKSWIRMYGPEPARGIDFDGCSDWRGPADLCSCATWEPVTCRNCGTEIHDGERIWLKLITDQWGQEFDNRSETWHESCEPAA